jgi:hypothetical protein
LTGAGLEARSRLRHSTSSDSLADILERVLASGVVIAGDIKLKIVDIELLTIQVRLVIASVDKAVEMGLDWWADDPNFCSRAGRARRRRAAARSRLPATAGSPALSSEVSAHTEEGRPSSLRRQ